MLYQPRYVSAQAAFDALKRHPNGLDWYAWASAAGLTDGQLRYAQGMLREVLQTANGEPLIWKSSTGVYKLGNTRAECDVYVAWRLRYLTTAIIRVEQTMKADLMKFGSSKTKRQVVKDMERLREDIVDLVATF